MAFRDITDILGPIELPVRGKVYTLPTLTIAQGLELRAVLDPDDDATLNDEGFYDLLLGDQHAAMKADGVTPDWIARAAFVALADWQSGRPAAETLWETGLDPKVLTTYLARLETLSTSTDEATTTQEPTPGTTTKSPKTSQPRASRGPKSSAAGTSSTTAS